MLYENILLALTGLLSNKMRTLLTMLGIIIGISSVIAIMTVGDSLSASVSSTMQSMGANNIIIGVKQRGEESDDRGAMFRNDTVIADLTENDRMTEEMMMAFQSDFSESVSAVSFSESVGNGTVKNGKLSSNISVIGINEGYTKANEVTLLNGRNFFSKDMEGAKSVALISDKAAKQLYGGDGSDILGKEIEVDVDGKYYSYTLVGIYEYKSSGMFQSVSEKDAVTNFYIPVSNAKAITNKTGYSTFTAVSQIGVDSDVLVSDINKYFDRYYRENDKFEVTGTSMESMISSVTTMMSTITLAISFIAGIALLVGGIGVMNILLVSITERTREIGTRKALGATNNSIRIQFVIESIVICLVGGIIGVTLGIILGSVASGLLGYAAQATISSIVLALGFSLAIGVFFGFYPANKAAKMNPIDALRYE